MKPLGNRLLVAHCIASIRSDHGGTSRSVPTLCESMAELNAEVHLVTAKPADSTVRYTLPSEKVHVHWGQETRWIRQLRVPSQFTELLQTIQSEAMVPMVVHDHGVWLRSNHAVARFCSRNKIPRIVSPRGMLTPWSMNHGRWKKRLAWKLFQQRDLQSATAFHATSQQEADEIAALGLTQPIFVIPNGVAFPAAMPPREAVGGSRRLLFLSRIHPKKGLIQFMRAWKMAAPSPEWKLVIAGPDECGHLAEVKQSVRENAIDGSVEFLGEIPDKDKWRFFATGSAFVLPSFSENFGNAVAEAMAASLPVIATTGTPWSVLSEQSMGWWVEPTPDSLAIALRQLTQTAPEQLSEMGERGAKFAVAQFGWRGVAEKMLDAYQNF